MFVFILLARVERHNLNSIFSINKQLPFYPAPAKYHFKWFDLWWEFHWHKFLIIGKTQNSIPIPWRNVTELLFFFNQNNNYSNHPFRLFDLKLFFFSTSSIVLLTKNLTLTIWGWLHVWRKYTHPLIKYQRLFVCWTSAIGLFVHYVHKYDEFCCLCATSGVIIELQNQFEISR